MFKAAEMQKIRVTGLRADLEGVIGALHRMGEVQFTKTGEGYFEADAPLEHFAEISEQLVRLRGIEAALVPQPDEKQVVGGWKEVVEECGGIQIDIALREIVEGREEMKRKRNEMNARLVVLKQLAPLDVDLTALRSPLLALIAGRIEAAKVAGLKEKVRHACKNSEMKVAQIDKANSVVLIACEMDGEGKVREALAKSGLAEVSIEGIEGNVRKGIEVVERELAEMAHEERRMKEEIDRLSVDYWARIAALREALELEEDRCVAAQKFGRSAKMFVFEGWIVKNKFEDVKKNLEGLVDDKVLVERAKVKVGHGHEKGEVVPTLLLTPKPLKHFESLIGFMSVPASDEIDPTALFAITFPLIYGMMVGDVGYGLCSILIAWLLLKKYSHPLLQVACKAWMIGAIPAIGFGIVYDEWFGFSHAHLLGLPAGQMLYEPLHRLTNTTLLLTLMIFVGIVHIFIGFLLGFINGLRHGDMKHALAKLGWMGVEVSGVVLVMSFLFNMISPEIGMAAGVVFFISLIPIVRAEGPLGLTEIPSMAGNILSYARIMAVGIAGVVIAEEIINKMLVPDPSNPVMFLIILPIFVLVHMLNIVLAMFESLVQGARLNLVEFFSKFYRGGGVPFMPFKEERKYTVAE